MTVLFYAAGITSSTLLTIALFMAFASCAPVDCGVAAATGTALYLMSNNDQDFVVALPSGAGGTLGQGILKFTGGGRLRCSRCGGRASESRCTAQPVRSQGGWKQNPNQSKLTPSRLTSIAHPCSQCWLQHSFCADISSTDPTSLQLVGQPVAVPGDFPNVLDVSGGRGTGRMVRRVGLEGGQWGWLCCCRYIVARREHKTPSWLALDVSGVCLEPIEYHLVFPHFMIACRLSITGFAKQTNDPRKYAAHTATIQTPTSTWDRASPSFIIPRLCD